ncbi:hypothetical protein PUN28_019338 [Cardiocondyla obscurior]|uniref:Secreted protein n=1 Tax=Cardiocondyla obscurior TaxID=286306 RepID=A0AAW2EBU4_9HYME
MPIRGLLLLSVCVSSHPSAHWKLANTPTRDFNTAKIIRRSLARYMVRYSRLKVSRVLALSLPPHPRTPRTLRTPHPPHPRTLRTPHSPRIPAPPHPRTPHPRTPHPRTPAPPRLSVLYSRSINCNI